MRKIILLTGATDGIGLETAKMLAEQNHHLILHGRNTNKLEQVRQLLLSTTQIEKVDIITADLSEMHLVADMAQKVLSLQTKIDVLINNAGIYNTPQTRTKDGYDVRFAVNTFAPYILTKHLLPLLKDNGRVVNLSSAAQSPVDEAALRGERPLSSGEAYAQSKLAITMWSHEMGLALKDKGTLVVSVNPKSFLGSKMVREAYGVAGSDIRLGADILTRAALSDEFSGKYGQYFDNDIGRFANPHPDALNDQKNKQLISEMDRLLAQYL